jgi:hypothetical protein
MVSSFHSIKFFLGEGYSAFRIDSWQTLIHTHNFFLEIWGREGIISAMIVIALLGYLLFKNIKSFHLWFIIGLPFAIVARDMFEVTMVVRVLRWEMIVFWLFLLLPLYYKDTPKSSPEPLT